MTNLVNQEMCNRWQTTMAVNQQQAETIAKLTKERNTLKNKIKESGRYKLREQLAAAQATIAKLRGVFTDLQEYFELGTVGSEIVTNALAIPSDTTALDERLAQERGNAMKIEKEKDMHELPDGSGFFVGSLPLPKDHWLYAPNADGWDSERDCSPDTPLPILGNSQREAVKAALRWAVRGATMCGTEPDFDPDALVLNAAYALCGPCGNVTPNVERNRDARPYCAAPVDGSVGHREEPK